MFPVQVLGIAGITDNTSKVLYHESLVYDRRFGGGVTHGIELHHQYMYHELLMGQNYVLSLHVSPNVCTL